MIRPYERAVRGYNDHIQFIYLAELVRLCRGRAGHAGKLIEYPEIILECYRRGGLVLPLDLDALFRLDRLMEAVRQSPHRHHASGELVYDYYLAVLDKVLHVTLV